MIISIGQVLNSFRSLSKYGFRPSLRQKSTIYALSSGYGKCGVAVIRVSGPSSLTVMKTMTNMNVTPTPRFTYLREIVHPNDGRQIDKGLAIWFPGWFFIYIYMYFLMIFIS